jgi:CRISPR-associated protein Cas2
MREKRHYLVIYDIRSPKRLRKVAKIAERYGQRVQYSVFELYTSPEVLAQLRNEVREVLKEEDYAVYFVLCEKDWQKQQKFGPGYVQNPDELEYRII